MLKHHSSFVKQSIAFLDCLLIGVAFYSAYNIILPYKNLSNIGYYFPIPIGYAIFYIYFAWSRQMFSVLQFSWMRNLLRRIVAIFLSAAVLGASILYMLPDAYNSRSLYLVFASLSFLIIFIEKLILRAVITSVRYHDKNITPIIILGRGRDLASLTKQINDHREWGLRISSKLDISITPDEFEKILKTSYIEEVFFSIPRSITREGFVIDPYLQICEEMGRPARVFMNLPNSTFFAKWNYHNFMGLPTFVSHTVELDPDQMLLKRFFDFIGAIIGCSILLVIYPFLAIAIKFTSPGPVFFRQIRVGKNGKRFIIYKFRSMSIDAEEKKKDLESKNEMEGAVFKMENDPRITTIGKFIRKYSLDELPQFINVLKSEMSLVGTRPPTPEEVSKYQKWHHRRISIRPGMTGMWQVSGRSKIRDFDEIVKMDLKYIDSWNILLDIKMIFKTIAVVFKKDGSAC